MSNRSPQDLIQIVIVLLLMINVAMTGSLWLSREKVVEVNSPAEHVLPAFVDSAELSRLAGEIKELYNARDIDGLYDLFDDVAKIQISKEQVDEQLGSFDKVLGNIQSVAYSHFEATTYAGQPVYVLHYAMRLEGGSFPRGTLKVTVVDRDGQLRLFGFNLFGGTGP